jgi:hypothetical protein
MAWASLVSGARLGIMMVKGGIRAGRLCGRRDVRVTRGWRMHATEQLLL